MTIATTKVLSIGSCRRGSIQSCESLIVGDFLDNLDEGRKMGFFFSRDSLVSKEGMAFESLEDVRTRKTSIQESC